MSSFKVLLCIVLGLAITSTCDAECFVCTTTTYAACINETAFVVCYDGVTPSQQIKVCDEGKVCTDNKGVCLTKADADVLGCSPVTLECNECANQFACVSQTEFSYCDASGATDVVVPCPSGQYCNAEQFSNGGTICGPSCLVTPTCSNTEVTTVAPIDTNWEATCNSTTVVAPGYNKNIQDPTCKTYVYCEKLNGVMNAILYTCSTGYFSQTTKTCVATKPSTCT